MLRNIVRGITKRPILIPITTISRDCTRGPRDGPRKPLPAVPDVEKEIIVKIIDLLIELVFELVSRRFLSVSLFLDGYTVPAYTPSSRSLECFYNPVRMEV